MDGQRQKYTIQLIYNCSGVLSILTGGIVKGDSDRQYQDDGSFGFYEKNVAAE